MLDVPGGWRFRLSRASGLSQAVETIALMLISGIHQSVSGSQVSVSSHRSAGIQHNKLVMYQMLYLWCQLIVMQEKRKVYLPVPFETEKCFL